MEQADFAAAVQDIRSRSMFLVTYAEEFEVELVLCLHHRQIMHYAYAFHDQDENVPHRHIALYLKTDYKLGDVIDWFKQVSTQNTFAEVLGSKNRAYQYLTHSNQPDKKQYDKSIIITDSVPFWEDKNGKARDCVNDIAHGMDLDYLIREYGRDIIMHYDKYANMAARLVDSHKSCFYIDDKHIEALDRIYNGEKLDEDKT